MGKLPSSIPLIGQTVSAFFPLSQPILFHRHPRSVFITRTLPSLSPVCRGLGFVLFVARSFHSRRPLVIVYGMTRARRLISTFCFRFYLPPSSYRQQHLVLHQRFDLSIIILS